MSKKKMPTWAIVLICIGILLLIAIIATPSNDDTSSTTTTTTTTTQTTTTTTTTEIEVIKTDAITIIADYHDNEVNANKKYKNKRVVVTDAIVYSTEDGYIKLECSDSDYWLQNIQAYYNSDYSDEIAKLSKGDVVTVEGDCAGLSNFGDVKLRNIKIL